jgi:soluble lytic murein transglycosylase-like protein
MQVRSFQVGVLLITLAIAGMGMAAETTPSSSPPVGCVEHAAAWAAVHPRLLRAIAWVESRGNSRVLNWNPNGTYDVGLMQINSRWYARGLARWWEHLRQPCVNVAAAAWVLKQCMDEYRYTWNAVGCYHAGSGWTKSPKKRPLGQTYIKRVQRALGVLGPRTRATPVVLQKSAVDCLRMGADD